jgi:hypothetical protein
MQGSPDLRPAHVTKQGYKARRGKLRRVFLLLDYRRPKKDSTMRITTITPMM